MLFPHSGISLLTTAGLIFFSILSMQNHSSSSKIHKASPNLIVMQAKAMVGPESLPGKKKKDFYSGILQSSVAASYTQVCGRKCEVTHKLMSKRNVRDTACRFKKKVSKM